MVVAVASNTCPEGQQRCGLAGCYNPTTQVCMNGTTSLECIYSCNGTCYSNAQHCYNNTKVCNNGEGICDIQSYVYEWFPYTLTCYNHSQYVCDNKTMCSRYYSCGTKCGGYYDRCVNNQTMCPGFYYWNTNVNVCGTAKTCYDNSSHTCLDHNNGTVCPIRNQLCNGVCYNSEAAYCIGGNNTVYCRENPDSRDCVISTTIGMATTPRTLNDAQNATSCCSLKNCTVNSDCCEQDSNECKCYRHNSSDTYGSCVNENVTPICGTSCPVKSQCRLDSDCCRNQCATITFIDAFGYQVSTRQCLPR